MHSHCRNLRELQIMNDEDTFDKQLWRDFDWETYINSQLPRHPTDKDKAEFKQGIETARKIAQLLEGGLNHSKKYELLECERTTPPNLHMPIMMTLAMFANTMYTAKHNEADKVNFAIGTINRLASLCRSHKINEVGPILRQFALELGENYKIDE